MNNKERMGIVNSVLKNKDSIKNHKFADVLKEWLEYAKTDNVPKELDEQFDKAWDEATDEVMGNDGSAHKRTDTTS